MEYGSTEGAYVGRPRGDVEELRPDVQLDEEGVCRLRSASFVAPVSPSRWPPIRGHGQVCPNRLRFNRPATSTRRRPVSSLRKTSSRNIASTYTFLDESPVLPTLHSKNCRSCRGPTGRKKAHGRALLFIQRRTMTGGTRKLWSWHFVLGKLEMEIACHEEMNNLRSILLCVRPCSPDIFFVTRK